MSMKGVSGSVWGVSRSGSTAGSASASSHQASRPGFQGSSPRASPNRRTTSTSRTVGAAATAASAVSFSRTIPPRRRKPSAVTSRDAAQSARRAATAGAPYPEKIGTKIARGVPSASTAVAGTNAMRLKHPGGEVHGPPQLLVGVAPDVAVLTLPGDGESLRITGRTTIDGRRSVVEGAAAPPARPLHAAGEVQRGRRPALPVERQVVRGRRPEPGRIHDGAGLEGLQVGLADGAQESGQEGCGRGRGIRSPGDAGHVAPEGRRGIRGAGAGHPPILAPGG